MIELNLIGRETASFIAKADIFKKYLPSAQIEIINAEKVPSIAKDFFEFKSRSLMAPRDYRPGNFSAFFLISHNSGGVTYVVQQTKIYDHKEGATETLVHIIDVDQFGNKQGDGEIRNNVSDNRAYFKNKPFVGWTETEENLRGKGLGLGLRRLLMMNALSQMLYGLPLHTDTIITRSSGRILKRLARKGKIDKYKEGERNRYVFKE